LAASKRKTAYIIVYALISMLLVWPHDRRVRLFLAPNEEPFVRVDFFTTLLLLPLPAAVFYLANRAPFETMEKTMIGVLVLVPLFIVLFRLAHVFTKAEEERERLALGQEVAESLGAPANMAEMTCVLNWTGEQPGEFSLPHPRQAGNQAVSPERIYHR
jgi:hypothetical protein